MSIRLIFTVIVFLITFFGLMSLVGNVHVAEFYGILIIAFITSLICWFKLGKFPKSKKVITKRDF
jgi:hypothetical protein